NRITGGPWTVLQVLRVDESTRTIWFTAAGKEPGDPYFRHLYSVRLDGTRLTPLTPEDADHDVTLAPNGRWFVDSYSRPDVPPVTLLRDATGRTLLTLERAAALERLPRRLLRQHGRQRHPRSDRRDARAGPALPVDRPRPRRDLRPLRRRLLLRGRDPALPRLLQSRGLRGGESRPAGVRGRLGGALLRPARPQARRHHQLRRPGEPTTGQEHPRQEYECRPTR